MNPEQKPKGSGRFYYAYLESFRNFLVPPEKKVLTVRKSETPDLPTKDGPYDYIVASDVLGFVADIEAFFRSAGDLLAPDGRIVITQYNALWEPILRVASRLGLRNRTMEQNWLSLSDIRNFSALAGLETVRSGTKMLFPLNIPLLAGFFNRILANIFPFSRLGLFHYAVLRKPAARAFAKAPSISIIVPARNEAGTIEKIARELPILGSFTEIIFIEGHSKDDTIGAIRKVAAENIPGKRMKFAVQDGKGKGDAVRKGFDMAEGDILAIYDADMTVPADEVGKFYHALVENKGDFINGSRLVYPLQKESMRIINFFGNKFFGFMLSSTIGQPIKDSLCGTKVLWRKDYEDIKRNRAFFGDFDPFGDFDLLFGAAKLNRKIIDMPIHYKDRIYGETNIRRWSHGWLLLKMTGFAMRKMKFI